MGEAVRRRPRRSEPHIRGAVEGVQQLTCFCCLHGVLDWFWCRVWAGLSPPSQDMGTHCCIAELLPQCSPRPREALFHTNGPLQLQVYQLLTGHLRRSDAIDGHALYGSGYGVTKGVDWKRAFALQYWYACPQNSTLRDALPKYDNAWLSASTPATREARAPLPPFVERNNLADETVFDTCYYLMWLRYPPARPFFFFLLGLVVSRMCWSQHNGCLKEDVCEPLRWR